MHQVAFILSINITIHSPTNYLCTLDTTLSGYWTHDTNYMFWIMLSSFLNKPRQFYFYLYEESHKLSDIIMIIPLHTVKRVPACVKQSIITHFKNLPGQCIELSNQARSLSANKSWLSNKKELPYFYFSEHCFGWQ